MRVAELMKTSPDPKPTTATNANPKFALFTSDAVNPEHCAGELLHGKTI
jgi:hypothetical protein